MQSRGGRSEMDFRLLIQVFNSPTDYKRKDEQIRHFCVTSWDPIVICMLSDTLSQDDDSFFKAQKKKLKASIQS